MVFGEGCFFAGFCINLVSTHLWTSVLKEDVKLMAVYVTTTEPRSKAATAKTDGGSVREIWEGKRGERERGKGSSEGYQQL